MVNNDRDVTIEASWYIYITVCTWVVTYCKVYIMVYNSIKGMNIL